MREALDKAIEPSADTDESALSDAAPGTREAESLEREQFHELANRIRDAARELPGGADEEVQNEVGLILRLVNEHQARDLDTSSLSNLVTAVNALVQSPPNRVLAARLREEAEQRLFRKNVVRSVLPGSSASTWVTAGLVTLLFLGGPLLIGAMAGATRLLDLLFTPSPVNYGLVLEGVAIGIAGAAGGSVSIMVRIRDFAEVRLLNPPALFWTGFSKPLIGTAFALFVWAVFESRMFSALATPEDSDRQWYFRFLALGFVAGFSERFAPDLVSKVEQSVTIDSHNQEAPSPESSRNSD